MRSETLILIAVYIGFCVVEFWRCGFFNKPLAKKDDGWVEFFSMFNLLIVTQPIILLGVTLIGPQIAPSYQDALIGIPLLAQFGLLLIFDDMTQYWWHRASHSFSWLYNLHRPHHNAEYMSVRLVYRNNVFYYMMMPGIWFSGILIYLGLGYAYAFYIIVKLTVITGAHCDWQWDAPLYKIKALSPVMWVVERLISTPSTHSMHHGKYASDEATNYKGNYGNLLFFWDVLFGTAQITRQRPTDYGVENLPDTSFGEQLFWPIIRRKS